MSIDEFVAKYHIMAKIQEPEKKFVSVDDLHHKSKQDLKT